MQNLPTLCVYVCFFDSPYLAALYRNQTHESFGKTHFILGYPETTPSETAQGPLKVPTNSAEGSYRRVLFAPDDDIQQELIALINQEKQSIKIAIFTFTDKQVAQALLDAHERGVAVEVVADAAYLRDQYSKIALLQHKKIPIYTYNPHYKNVRQNKPEFMSIMHHKFVVFRKNVENKSLVWTGSFNFTRSAKLRNQENVIILDDAYTVKKFEQQFDQLKRRCDDCYEEVEKTKPNQKRLLMAHA